MKKRWKYITYLRRKDNFLIISIVILTLSTLLTYLISTTVNDKTSFVIGFVLGSIDFGVLLFIMYKAGLIQPKGKK